MPQGNNTCTLLVSDASWVILPRMGRRSGVGAERRPADMSEQSCCCRHPTSSGRRAANKVADDISSVSSVCLFFAA